MENIEKDTHATARQIAERNRDIRREVFMRRVLDGLLQTVQVRAIAVDTPTDDYKVFFTDASARYLAPLLEAVGILEAIIYASDGCRGHLECVHSMVPWQRARALLEGKWRADSSHGEQEWPEIPR